ncbi:ArsR/SmtB family transcription factor [Serratia sp. NPDC078593]|uniref:ArsR/SmtB family transcription factor n=1 Tax=unclassified Serratia (in: enterobacteria) TaxID=2647522 RepID=UPI0037D6909C
MTKTERDLLYDNASQAVTLLKSMSNSNRLLILCILIDSPGTSAGNLSQLTGLSPSATSQHLARMKDEGLIACTRDAQKMHYFIKNESIIKIISTLKEIYCPEGF